MSFFERLAKQIQAEAAERQAQYTRDHHAERSAKEQAATDEAEAKRYAKEQKELSQFNFDASRLGEAIARFKEALGSKLVTDDNNIQLLDQQQLHCSIPDCRVEAKMKRGNYPIKPKNPYSVLDLVLWDRIDLPEPEFTEGRRTEGAAIYQPAQAKSLHFETTPDGPIYIKGGGLLFTTSTIKESSWRKDPKIFEAEIGKRFPNPKKVNFGRFVGSAPDTSYNY